MCPGVQQGATLIVDEATTYLGLPRFGHESVSRFVPEDIHEQAHTYGLEPFWSMLKRGYIGTYYGGAKHFGRYVSKLGGRHNLRGAATTLQMEAMASGFLGKRLRYAEPTA